MFACVPPPSIWGGWLTFSLALAVIGLVTAIVGDLAAIFGCLIGLKDSVTAITFVALGTSLPDLFASKQAAIQEKYADNSIGNVTGSNSVNVFLGLGMPWVIAAIYWTAKVLILLSHEFSLFSILMDVCSSVHSYSVAGGDVLRTCWFLSLQCHHLFDLRRDLHRSTAL